MCILSFSLSSHDVSVRLPTEGRVVRQHEGILIFKRFLFTWQLTVHRWLGQNESDLNLEN